MQVVGASGERNSSSGRTRIVALVCSLISASQAPRAAAAGVDEAAVRLHAVEELLLGGARGCCSPRGAPAPSRAGRPASAPCPRAIALAEPVHRHGLLLPAGAPGQHDRAGGHIARPELEPQRDAPPLPLVVLGARLHALAGVEVDPDSRRRPAPCAAGRPPRARWRAPRRSCRSARSPPGTAPAAAGRPGRRRRRAS